MRVMRYQTVIRMIDAMATDLVDESRSRNSSARRFDSVEDVRRAGRALACFSAAMAPQVDELKQIMRDRLYRHYRVSRMTEKAGRVLARLFETYMARAAPDARRTC